MSLPRKTMGTAAALLLLPAPAFAAINGADTAWMMMATILVLSLTTGLAFHNGGMVRSKNVVSTLAQSFVAIGVIGLVWSIIGYSVAFSSGGDTYLGDTAHYMLRDIGADTNIPTLLGVMFSMGVAIFAAALLSGALAERLRFQSWLLILVLWSLAVYAPVAHWVWTDGGFLAKKGAIDGAGGLVVALSAGFSALAAAIVVGKRRDATAAPKPYNLGMMLLGTGMLWGGWFGLTGGAAMGANAQAAQALANTILAPAAAMVMWVLVDSVKGGKPTLAGCCGGAVAGLAAILAGAGTLLPESAIIVGLVAGFFCNHAARLIAGRYAIDDTRHVFATYGIGGLIGALAVGVIGDGGTMSGDNTVLAAQATAAAVIAVYSMVATVIILKAVGAVMPIRVTDAEEKAGLDGSQHGEVIDNHD